MRVELTLALILAGCGRIGFGAPASGDAMIGDRGPGDGGPGDGDPGDGDPGDGTAVDAPPDAPALPATITYLGTASSVQNLSAYTFAGQLIGPAAANRIVVVCAHLGGGAITPITSITVGATPLTLTGSVTDGTSGSDVIGYALIPAGANADITVTSTSAGRAAIAVLNVTATSVIPTGGTVAMNSNADTNTISTLIGAQSGGVVLAAAGYGSDNPTWLWGGTWTGHTEHLDATWSEQGSYTIATAAIATGGFLTVNATPSVPTGKLLGVAAWR